MSRIVYCDGPLPFEKWGTVLFAHHYNVNAAKNGGNFRLFIRTKPPNANDASMCAVDFEYGIPDNIRPDVWLADRCIGNWHYQRGIRYLTPKQVVDMFVESSAKRQHGA